jgi:rhodanese-related sulfurtransferase
MKHVTPRECLALCEKGALLVDVREDYMNTFKTFDVPEVMFLPYTQFQEKYASLPDDRHLIIADAAGINSKKAVEFLLKHGFEKIANLAGGIVEWERDGLPLVTDKRERLTGSCMCMLRKRERK